MVGALIACAGLAVVIPAMAPAGSAPPAGSPGPVSAAAAVGKVRPEARSGGAEPTPPMISAPGGSGAAPRVTGLTATATRSLNWAGYAVSGGHGAFTSAQTTFVVPSLQSCGSTESSAASFWAGIDGFTSSTVEQDGVDVYCSSGVVSTFAWYEVYPAPPVVLSHVTVRPGDTVVASVNYQSGTTYQLEVNDTTTHTSTTTTASVSGAVNSSAECIAEDPGATPVPYAQYASVSFSSCTANGSAIGVSPNSLSSITTVSSQGSTVATPGALTNNTAFAVTRPAPTPATVTASTTASAPTPTPTTPTPAPLTGSVVGMASTPSGNGYWLASASGAVSAHGAAAYYGSMAGATLNSPITHIVATSDGLGYWLVAGDGGTFAFGDAAFYGSMGGRHLNAPVVDMAPTPDDRGYWLVASDGGIFAFGDAVFYGSMGGQHLNAPVVAITADPATGGYWLVASDGGVFSFHAPFFGSTGAIVLNKPIVAMAAAAPGAGYWFVAADGGVFAFNAPFQGSEGGQSIPAPIVGMAPDPTTNGYWLVGRDGSVYSFGAPFYGAR